MSINDKETLSQLMDGEWQDLNPSKSVEAACADDALKATWSRYHLIRDVIRNDEIKVDSSLTSRISQAIADEPTYSNVSAIGQVGQSSASDHNTVMQTESVQTEESVSRTNEAVSDVAEKKAWRTGLSGVALAACVALATVLGMNFWQGAPESGSTVQTVATVPGATVPGVVLPEVEYVSNKGTYWVSSEPTRSAAAEKRLNMLLSAHIESSPTAERTGMLPYSRLVGYDEVAPE